MIGISEHDFDNLTLAEKGSLLDYYLEILEAMNLPTQGSFLQNAAFKEDFEAQFLGDISYPQTPIKIDMENLGFEVTNMESPEMIRARTLERLATSNLKAIEGYIAHHPADEGAKAILSNSKSILSTIKSKIQSTTNDPWPKAAETGDIGLQVPSTREIPFAPPRISIQVPTEEHFHHICAMNAYRRFSPEELHLEAYRREHNLHSSPHPRDPKPAFTSLQVPSTSNPFYMPSIVGASVPGEERFQHICAMEHYQAFSPDELRLIDHHRAQKLWFVDGSKADGEALGKVGGSKGLDVGTQTDDVKETGDDEKSGLAIGKPNTVPPQDQYNSLFNPPKIQVSLEHVSNSTSSERTS
ncbi:MAG: hypothetical protein Q9180_007167 [Flavoplaca navasiana]